MSSIQQQRGSFLKDSSVVVVVLESSEVYIIISLSSRNDSQVIYVDPTTGSLCYDGKAGKDLFGSMEQALNYITDGSRLLCKSTIYARAALGYSVLGSLGLLLVATKLSVSIPNLPGGGCVYTVTESKWIKIQLQNPQVQGKGEIKNINELADLDIDGKYFFCETMDITRPFPSRMSLQNPDEEFVWNGWFSKAFADIGLPKHCGILLQGFAECRNFGGTGQQMGTVALIARRSRLHPGTRYLARGLNACCSTGNEVECEQIVWIPQKIGETVPFSSYVWRRGTIPIWWGAELKLATEAEIYVSAQDPYRGSLLYYQRLSRRYSAQSSELAAIRQKKASVVPIVCVNLLRSGEGKSENILVEHFKESIKFVRSTGKLQSTLIQLINYDWHATVKSRGEQVTVEGLWKYLKAPTMAIGFCEGAYYPSLKPKGGNGIVVSTEDIEGGFCLKSLQNGVIRFNCADSLDRTNAASYFGALQVFVEQCGRLCISLDRDALFRTPSVNKYGDSSNYGGNSATLPPGWEERFDSVTGKHFYIDHNTRTTSWEHPSQGKPWKRFDMSFDLFKNSTMLSPVNQLADLFLLAGDIHATLYTGSKAMHSQILNIFSDDGGKFSKFSTAQNVKITLQRRYQNVLVDSSRQKQLEIFLGLRLYKHLPSIPVHPLKVLSRPPGFFLKPIPSVPPISDGSSSLLSFKKKDLVWVCPQAADVVELFIYLAEPCHVCQLLLTVSHGAEDSYFPATVDIRTGRTLDNLKLVLEGACIPRCSNGTNLLIPLSGKIDSEDIAVTGKGSCLHVKESSYLPLLYDFEELEGELDFLTRIVTLTFYPSVPGRTPLTLGEIEVLGGSLPWTAIFTGNEVGSRYIKFLQKRLEKSDNVSHGVNVNDPNPFLSKSNFGSCTTFNETSLLQSQTSKSNNFIDLLTGDLISSSQSDISSKTESLYLNSQGTNDLFGGSYSEIAFQASHDETTDSVSKSVKNVDGVEHYINLYKSISASNKGSRIEFLQALKLEIERFRLNLSAAQRDKALLSIGIDHAILDPNRLLDGDKDDTDDGALSICRHADSLALLGQAALEDKINASIGLETVNDIVDFWNINEYGEACYGGECEVCFPSLSTAGSSTTRASPTSPVECSECGRKACKYCSAGKGAHLLANRNTKEMKIYNSFSSQSGSNNGGRNEGNNSSHSTLLDGIICKRCVGTGILKALHVDYVRVLSSLRKRGRVDAASRIALDQVLGLDTSSESNIWQSVEVGKRQLRVLTNGAYSLAEYPYASLLHEVETAKGSEPIVSLIAPLGVGNNQRYWKAPPNVSSAEFSVALESLSDVSGVAIIISSCGYSMSDCPKVEIWTSNMIHNEERSYIGKWDMKSLVSSSSSQLYGPEKTGRGDDIPRHAKFQFHSPVRCRIIWITLTLPQLESSANSFDEVIEEYNPFAFDESLSLESKPSGNTHNDRCIHAKRLIIYGEFVREDDQDVSMELPELIRMKRFLEKPPSLNRFRVPVESESSRDHDLVLEQVLSPSIPLLAGFRFDAFNVVKPRTTHSPPPMNMDIWESSLTCLEDRCIVPAVLFIQVSVYQDLNYITIGEYRLPEVKAGTALYFDFPQPIESRVIVFKLLGDVTAFVDEIAEKDGSTLRNFPLASGLSLSSRIKLYYYADPYELGKMASLTAV